MQAFNRGAVRRRANRMRRKFWGDSMLGAALKRPHLHSACREVGNITPHSRHPHCGSLQSTRATSARPSCPFTHLGQFGAMLASWFCPPFPAPGWTTRCCSPRCICRCRDEPSCRFRAWSETGGLLPYNTPRVGDAPIWSPCPSNERAVPRVRIVMSALGT